MPRKLAFLMVPIALAVLAAGTQLHIRADDLLRFDVTRARAKSGEEITVTLENTGKLSGHKHNFVLLKPGADMASLGQSPDGSLPPDASIAHTAMAGPGESVTVRFRAPAPGTYTYICSYPGHLSKSRGELVVE